MPLIAIVHACYSAYDCSRRLLCIRVRVKDRERREELRELKEAHQNTLKAKNDENVRSSLIALRQLMLAQAQRVFYEKGAPSSRPCTDPVFLFSLSPFSSLSISLSSLSPCV